MATTNYSTPQGSFDWSSVLDATNAANSAAPSLLTQDQRNTMRANTATAANTSLTNNLGSMAQSMGGVGTAAFGAQKSRMQAASQASTANQMANVDIDQNQKAADLEMQRRAQQIQAGQLGVSENQALAQNQQFYAGQDLQKAQMRSQNQQFWGSLLGGPGGQGGTGVAGGSSSASSLASGMGPIYQSILANGGSPRAVGAYNRYMLQQINQARQQPATMDTWLANLQRVLDFGSDNSTTA
jgi:hypothetical protein